MSMSLLLPDGAVNFTFQPELNAKYYSAWLQLAQTVSGQGDLRRRLEYFAPIWGIVAYSMESS